VGRKVVDVYQPGAGAGEVGRRGKGRSGTGHTRPPPKPPFSRLPSRSSLAWAGVGEEAPASGGKEWRRSARETAREGGSGRSPERGA
jgi:hypothetical protein